MATTLVFQSCPQLEKYDNIFSALSISRSFFKLLANHRIKAMKELKPDATGIYVAAHQASAAIEEAIEAEVPLIVAVAEHIPIHEIMKVCSYIP